MKRFALFIAEIVLGLTVIVGVALFARHTSPPSETIRWWHFTACELPCWAAIVPGVTSSDEAQQTLARLFAAPAYSVDPGDRVTGENTEEADYYIVGQDTDATMAPLVTFKSAEGVTEGITVESNILPSLGDMLVLLGLPTCVEPAAAGTDFLMLYFTNRDGSTTIEIDVDAQQALVKSIGNLQIYPSDPAADCTTRASWHGLAHADFYRRAIP